MSSYLRATGLQLGFENILSLNQNASHVGVTTLKEILFVGLYRTGRDIMGGWELVIVQILDLWRPGLIPPGERLGPLRSIRYK